MSWDFLILGSSGIQGKIVTRALLEKGYKLFLTDLYPDESKNLLKGHRSSKSSYLDVRDMKAAIACIRKIQPKVVINCAEGDHNFEVYQACLKARSNVIDLGSDIPPTRKQLNLHKEFKKEKIIGITGCGSTPGINNVMLKYGAQKFDAIDSIEAGFVWDSNIKEFVVPFSISSILYELDDPSDYMENGKFKKLKNPLRKPRYIKHAPIDKQACFIVSGHAEPYTFWRYFKNKGVKNVRLYGGFPEHSLQVIKTFIKLGFRNDKKDVSVEYEKRKERMQFVEVTPLDVLTQILKRIGAPKKYKETEVLWTSIFGKKGNKKLVVKMKCLVKSLKGWDTAGCNIDTGITAAIIAQMIKDKEIDKYGSFVPEQVVPETPFFNHLSHYDMKIFENGLLIN
jgi:lysine 6-dehydrogenase